MAKKDEVLQSSPKVAEPTFPAIPQGAPTGLAGNITAQDLRLPRVALLQALSPQVQNDPTTYKQGMYINSLTQDVIADVVFTPVFLFKNVVKYRPRTEGGGIIYKTSNFTPDVIKDISWDGASKPTATQFINVVALVKGQDIPLILSFSNTSFKAGQDLLTLVQLSGQAWRFNYTLTADKVTNTKGTFYVMRVRRGQPTDADAVIHAASLYEQVKGMSIDTDFENAHQESSTSTAGEPTEF